MSTLEIKGKILDKQMVLGTFLMELDTPGIAQILKNAGLEFVVLDMEHGGFDINTIKKMARYCKGADLLSIVRVPVGQYHYVARALDAGAKGIIVPMTETAEQISDVVQFAKYYPHGKRGTAFGIAHDDYRVSEVTQTMQQANAETLVVPLIESAKGIENLEEIIQVDGVDLIWVGHFDLSQTLGIPGQFKHPLFVDAMEHLIQTCKKYNKPCGRLVPNIQEAMYWREKGFSCISYGSDISILYQSVHQFVTQILK